MTTSSRPSRGLRAWFRLVVLTGVATVPAALLAHGMFLVADGADHPGLRRAFPLFVAGVALAGVWSVAACAAVLARRRARPAPVDVRTALGVVAGVAVGYAAWGAMAVDHVGHAPVFALAMPELAFATFTVARRADLLLRTVVGVAAVLPAGFLALGAILFPAAALDLLPGRPGSGDTAGVLLGAAAFGVGHLLVFVASGLGGWPARR